MKNTDTNGKCERLEIQTGLKTFLGFLWYRLCKEVKYAWVKILKKKEFVNSKKKQKNDKN